MAQSVGGRSHPRGDPTRCTYRQISRVESYGTGHAMGGSKSLVLCQFYKLGFPQVVLSAKLGRTKEGSHGKKVYCSPDRRGTRNVARYDEKAEGFVSASSASAHAPQGRCQWPQLDREKNCGRLLVSDENGRQRPATPRDRRR